MANTPNKIVLILDSKKYLSSDIIVSYIKSEKRKEVLFDTSDKIEEAKIFTKKQAKSIENKLLREGFDCIVIPTTIYRYVWTIRHDNVSHQQLDIRECSQLEKQGLIFDSEEDANSKLIEILEKKKEIIINKMESDIDEVDRQISSIYRRHPSLKRDLILEKILEE